MSHGQPNAVIGAWFALSVVAVIGTRIGLFVWLARKDADVDFLWAGTPGYLETTYYRWCQAQGRPRGFIMSVLTVSLVNAIVASAAFYLSAQ